MKTLYVFQFQNGSAKKWMVKRMSRFDHDREDIIRVLYSILDYARLGYEISTCDNCNTCKRKSCEYRPRVGQAVRWRCPLWKGEEDADKE